jgi:hypothetical protein
MYVKNLIASRRDWLAVLVDEYKVKANADGDLVSLKYNQIESPMHEPIVQECRGMVVHVPTGRIVAHPYNKFWNHGEELAATLDWSTARAQEKLDGSLMILYWHDGDWQVASSGTPKAGGSFGAGPGTFADAFWERWHSLSMRPPHPMWRDTTFMFELCDADNRIVVKYDRPRIVLHGARDLTTGREIPRGDLEGIAEGCGWEIVREMPIASIETALALAEALDPIAQEGFVVVDDARNRVKIKSSRYVALHHMRGEGMSVGRAIDLWVSGETAELLAHFPEFRDDVLAVHDRLDAAAASAVADCLRYRRLPDRKTFAQAVKAAPWSAVTFKLYGRDALTLDVARDVMRSQSKASLERLVAP